MSIHCELCTKCRMRGTRGPFSTNFLRCADLQNFSFSPEAAKALACMGLHGACHALQLANCLEDDYGLAQAALDLWQTLDNWVMKRRRQIRNIGNMIIERYSITHNTEMKLNDSRGKRNVLPLFCFQAAECKRTQRV